MFNKEDIQTKRVTASGVLVDKPCWLFSIIANDYDSTSSFIRVFNGLDTTGVLTLDLGGSQYGSDIIVFNVPLYFAHGIYVDFQTNGYSVFVQYIPEY